MSTLNPPSEVLLSVTITNFNYGKYLSRCIDSILSQSFRDFEIIIVDNASNDNSISILEDYSKKDHRIHLIKHQENVGLYQSLCESCRISRGKYCVHLDPDDWILNNDAFKIQIHILENNPDVVYVYSHRAYANNSGDVWYASPPHPNDTILPGAIEVENALSWKVAHTGPMFRMDAFRAIGGYAPGYLHGIDIKLPADLCTQGMVSYIHKPLYITLEHQENLHNSIRVLNLMNEAINAIHSIFNSPFGLQIPNGKKIKNRLLAFIYLRIASDYMYSNREKDGWTWLWRSIREYPSWTLRRPGTAVAIFKGIIGIIKNGRQTRKRSASILSSD